MSNDLTRYISGDGFEISELFDWINYAEIGILILDPDGTVRHSNRFAYDSLECNTRLDSFHDLPGKNIVDYAGEFIIVLKQAENDPDIKGMELHVTSLDQQERWLLIDCHRAEYKNGEILEVVFKDITSYKKIQVALCESEKQLHSIIETIPDVVYRLDPQGRFTFISEAIRDYGYEPEKLIGTPMLDIIHPEDRDEAHYRVNERRTGERKTQSFELRILVPGHDYRTVEVEDTLLNGARFFSISAEGIYVSEDDNKKSFIGTQGIARDISRRMNAEISREDAEMKCNAVLQSLQDGYYEFDQEKKVRYMNRALSRIFGYDEDELQGMSYYELVAPEDHETIDSIFNEIMSTGKPSDFKNLSIQRKSGKKRVLDGSASPVHSLEGTVTGIRGIARDVTERSKIQDELLQARKLEAIGILAGGIAHDYNNALTAIIGNLSLARMEADQCSDNLKEILTDAEDAALKIKELTQRLSTFARGGRPDKKLTTLDDLLEDTVDYSLENYGGTWNLDIEEGLWKAEIDVMQISQALQHILVNAREAQENRGHIEIRARNINVEKEASHHEISLQPGEYVLISVKDSGNGIEAEEVHRIFDPYYTTREMSSGMGLAISYAVIKRHRGYIDVISEKGKGAEFLVYLPAANDTGLGE
jgi:PAS domain S-box-containing protein